MNKFIYLIPGNWFELRTMNPEKTYPYDLQSFKNEIINQVNSRSAKLSFINISFGSRYSKCQVDEISMHISEDIFNKISELLSKENRHPVITFHGTSYESVKSIIASGYIIPHTGNNKSIVKMKHGSLYGVGIYSSPFFDKANYYTTDKDGFVYVIINFVLLGTSKMIPPTSSLVDKNYPNCGKYTDGSNTRIVFGLEQLVSADPNRIIPIGTMKISIK